MILADTSVWVDHFKSGSSGLESLLEQGRVCGHPFVIGELACGNLQSRQTVIDLLGRLPQAPQASQDEVLHFIDVHELMGRGVGFIDVHLLAATALAGDARLWTKDRRLAQLAGELQLSHVPS
ncbi:MAG: type II toxin-antitoxin system VapC family toxin [Woeseiaceae bacterium]|nr:type II toxin-antitoxin system VapC family toxin [Woeseiaceae bacterium]